MALSYMRRICSLQGVDRKRDGKEAAEALEWWAATAVVAGALIYGVVSAIIGLARL